MKKLKAGLVALLVMVISITACGCSIGDLHVYVASTSGIGNVFKIGPMTCSKKEFRVYLDNYKNLYGTFEGTNLWGQGNDELLSAGLKSAVLEHLTKVYSLNLYARDNDITLNKDEEKACEKAAEEYHDSLSSKDKSYMHASESDIRKMYERYALAEKVYFQLMNSVDEEVSEDEARVMEAEVIYTTDSNKAKLIQDQLKNGATFATVAQTYSEADNVKVTFGRDEYPAEVDKVVFTMENGQTSNMITTDDGYYFFHCINKYNKELSEQNKSNVIANRKNQLMEDMVSEQEDKYYSHYSESTLENLSISMNEEASSDSFFEVLNKYVSFK